MGQQETIYFSSPEGSEFTGYAVAGMVGNLHPETSRVAAVESAENNLSHRKRILVLLADAGHRGLTAAEAGRVLGISTQLAGARFLELRGDDNRKALPRLIMRTDVTRAIKGGKPGIVHVLTGLGWIEARKLMPHAG